MVKLSRNAAHPRHWVAYSPEFGWVAFPDKENGWDERNPARGLDPLHLRSVPVALAAHTGIPHEHFDFAEVA